MPTVTVSLSSHTVVLLDALEPLENVVGLKLSRSKKIEYLLWFEAQNRLKKRPQSNVESREITQNKPKPFKDMVPGSEEQRQYLIKKWTNAGHDKN